MRMDALSSITIRFSGLRPTVSLSVGGSGSMFESGERLGLQLHAEEETGILLPDGSDIFEHTIDLTVLPAAADQARAKGRLTEHAIGSLSQSPGDGTYLHGVLFLGRSLPYYWLRDGYTVHVMLELLGIPEDCDTAEPFHWHNTESARRLLIASASMSIAGTETR